MNDGLRQALVQASAKTPPKGSWAVLDNYVVSGEGYVRGEGKLTAYRPLVDVPDLFLRFARAGEYEEPDVEAWVARYGVLGLARGSMYGPESYADTAREMRLAGALLRLYEAATDPSGVDTETIAGYIAPGNPHLTRTAERARAWAMAAVARHVRNRLYYHTTATLVPTVDNGYVEGFDFHNLLGALHLQMMWLMTSADAKRCLNPECNALLTVEEPAPYSGGYTTRSDKRYCSSRCRNRASYLRRRLR